MGATSDTIAAVATPGGRGGIGIVRVSGPAAPDICTGLSGVLPAARAATLRAFRDGRGEIIDRGIVLYFPAPGSYTGEDVVEFHGHGGRVVMDLLLGRALELGARLARPGEFTERAFLNGKLDLVQAEAVADLIDSLSAAAARGAARSLEGAFSDRIKALQDSLTAIRVQVESGLDFPEETDAGADLLQARLDAWLRDAAQLAAAARSGRVLREGLRVVIAGPPNAGKSSLLNRLCASDRAIVSDAPGTTRDILEEGVEVGGIRMHVVDTAGIREARDVVEAEGVRRARAAMAGADLVLLVDEYARGLDAAFHETAASLPAGARQIRVRNKIDLCGASPSMTLHQGIPHIALCAKSGEGLPLLVSALSEAAGLDGGGEDTVLARERHVSALTESREGVQRALAAWRDSGAAELVAEELRGAQDPLGRITGEVSADDLLGEIFARFCIGK